MLDNDRGHIVTIASMAGLAGTAGLVDYCASKHAAVGYARSLSAELRHLGKHDKVRANLKETSQVHTTTVCPFYIDTGMFHGVKTKAPNSLPILQPEYVVENIMEAVLTNKEIIQLPRFCYLFTWTYRWARSRTRSLQLPALPGVARPGRPLRSERDHGQLRGKSQDPLSAV